MKLATTGLLTAWFAIAGVTIHAQNADPWSRVERLPLGETIIVTDGAGATIRGRLLRADATSILLYAPTIEDRALKAIARTVADSPQFLSRVDRIAVLLQDSDTYVGVTGISQRGRRIAAFDEVFHATIRSEVVTVALPHEQRQAIGPMIGGLVVGFGVGWFSAIRIGLSDSPCQPNCQWRYFGMGASLVGGPLLGAVAGNALGKPHDDLVIYARR